MSRTIDGLAISIQSSPVNTFRWVTNVGVMPVCYSGPGVISPTPASCNNDWYDNEMFVLVLPCYSTGAIVLFPKNTTYLVYPLSNLIHRFTGSKATEVFNQQSKQVMALGDKETILFMACWYFSLTLYFPPILKRQNDKAKNRCQLYFRI